MDMYSKIKQRYKDVVELKLEWTTRIYENKKDNVLIRFDNAYFLSLDEKTRNKNHILNAIRKRRRDHNY